MENVRKIPKGKIIRFDQIRPGRALIKLSDGNYLELILNVLKVIKTERIDPEGNPIYVVRSNTAMTVWKTEEIVQLESQKDSFGEK